MKAEDSPSLLSLARARSRKVGPECSVASFLRSDHPKLGEVRELLQALADKEVKYSAGASVLKEAGIELKADTLSRHARGACSCVQ